MLLRQLAESFGLRDHLAKGTDLGGNNGLSRAVTHDLEPLIKLGVFPKDLSFGLREFQVVFVRIDVENLGGHARPC
jgi:hypothetical protein